MLFDLLINFLVTPENIIGLILEVMTIVGVCFVFIAWGEKWWKSLIPFYGTYVIYKHTWKEKKWMFFIPIIFNIIGARSMSVMRKNIVTNVLDTIKTYIEAGELNVDIDVSQLVVCIIVFLISMLVSFIITRITYMKICDSLSLKNGLLKVGTFVLPQAFILIDYLCYKKKNQNLKINHRQSENVLSGRNE